MPEKFMFIAIMVYLTAVFVTAVVEAYWLESLNIASPKTRLFYISSFQWFAILAFLILSHPFIYRFERPLHWRELLAPNLHTLIFIIICLSLIALSSYKQIKHFARHWWSPLPLILAILSSIWLSFTMANALGTPVIIWPDWRFVSVSCVIYLAALVICDIFLSFGSNLTSSAWHRSVAETTRLCAVLPAFFVFLLGLSID